MFGEAPASRYDYKFWNDAAGVRIGSLLPEARNHRALSMRLSHEEYVRLRERVLSVPGLECPFDSGTSNEESSWCEKGPDSCLVRQLEDDAECYLARIDAEMAPPAPEAVFQVRKSATDSILVGWSRLGAGPKSARFA